MARIDPLQDLDLVEAGQRDINQVFAAVFNSPDGKRVYQDLAQWAQSQSSLIHSDSTRIIQSAAITAMMMHIDSRINKAQK